MSQMLVGIDVSLRSHHVHFMDEAGKSLANFSVPNSVDGADTLISKLLEKTNKLKSQSLRIGMEATSNL